MTIENPSFKQKNQLKYTHLSEQQIELLKEGKKLNINPELLNNPDVLAKNISERFENQVKGLENDIEKTRNLLLDQSLSDSGKSQKFSREIEQINQELTETKENFMTELDKEIVQQQTEKKSLETKTEARYNNEILKIAQRMMDQRLRLENLPGKSLTEMNQDELDELFEKKPHLKDIYEEAEEIYRKREERKRKEEEYKSRTLENAEKEKRKLIELKEKIGSLNPEQVFESYKEDPRFQLILQEKMVNWIETQEAMGKLPDFLSPEGQDFLHGKQDEPHSVSLEKRALDDFKRKYPELWEKYKKIENKRVYDDPYKDPVVRETENRILELTNKGLGSTEQWKDRYVAVSRRLWNDFVKNYPEKAAAYAEKNQEIKSALERIQGRKKEGQVKEQEVIAEKPSFLGRVKEIIGDKKVNYEILSSAAGLSGIYIENEPRPESQAVIFRGINDPGSIFNQAPYAMRVIGPDGKTKINEELRPFVENLAQNPTYQSLTRLYNQLIEYYNGILKNPSLSEETKQKITNEKRRLRETLEEIEDDILKGSPLPEILTFRQVFHNGGVMETDLTPYVSASRDWMQASEYGSYILVLRLPPSRLISLSPDSKEVSIKGQITPEDIIGILIKDVEEFNSNDMGELIKSITQKSNIKMINQEDLNKNFSEEQEKWQKNLMKDKKLVQKRRIRNLIKEFSELIFDKKKIEKKLDSSFREKLRKFYKESNNLYPAFLKSIFECLVERIEEKGYDVNKLKYQTSSGQLKEFNIHWVNDEMLRQLWKVYQKLPVKK